MFKPLAFTKTYSMGAAAIFAITTVPILIGYFVRGKMRSEDENPLTKLLLRIYHPVVDFIMKQCRDGCCNASLSRYGIRQV